MDIHIDRKIAGLMIVSLVIGLIIGGAIGAACARHGKYGRHHGRDQMYFLQRGGMPGFMPGQMKGSIQYFDEQTAPSMMQALPGTTTAPAPVEIK